MQGARTISSFFASAVSKAGKTVTEAGAKIKKTVEETVTSLYPLVAVDCISAE